MHGIKVGDTVRISYRDVRDNTSYAYIFDGEIGLGTDIGIEIELINGEICTVIDIGMTAALITSKAIREHMHEKGIDGAGVVCDTKYLIPLAIEEEDIDANDVLI